MLHTWLRAVRALMLGLWAGGILMTFIAAPAVFEQLKDNRTKAGNIVGEVLKVGGKVKMGLGLTALALEAVIFYGGAAATVRGWRRYAPAGLLMAALSVALLSSLWLEPKIHDLRTQIPDFSEATKGTPERMEFSKLHGMSMGLALLEMLLVVVTLVVGLL
jgi:hypothetical protein